MTTNHYSKLDPALIRPGRVDVHEYLDDAAGEQAERLFTKFYTSAGADSAKDTSRATPGPVDVERLGTDVSRIVDEERSHGRMVSMASLQGLFIRSGPREAVEQIRSQCRPHPS